ncbi:MAG: hypothetical protein Q4D98_11235 [Planctomycetia bacterium]|nr:hypothetical protein [Planctomycetia bacterium]
MVRKQKLRDPESPVWGGVKGAMGNLFWWDIFPELLMGFTKFLAMPFRILGLALWFLLVGWWENR